MDPRMTVTSTHATTTFSTQKETRHGKRTMWLSPSTDCTTTLTDSAKPFSLLRLLRALRKDSWATIFYKYKDVKRVTTLKEVLNAATAVLGAVAAFAWLGGPAAGVAAGAGSAMFAGAIGLVTPLLGQHQDDTFQKSADLGDLLGSIVFGAMKSFISANNVPMRGNSFQDTGDIRTCLKGDYFLGYPGIDKVAVIDMMNAKLVGHVVNAL
ncbi:MAG: hypothetical protein Q9209_005685 [Squamulea sp. 1 TL-2023]